METRTLVEPCTFTVDDVKQLLYESEARFAAGIFVSEEEMEEVWNTPLV